MRRGGMPLLEHHARQLEALTMDRFAVASVAALAATPCMLSFDINAAKNDFPAGILPAEAVTYH